MATQLQIAVSGVISPQVKEVAAGEGVDPAQVSAHLAAGHLVIPANPGHRALRPRGIGRGLAVKVNANLGVSGLASDLPAELDKLEAALEAGAAAVMDLSSGTAGAIDATRRAILDRSPVPVGTVPIYQAAVRAQERRGAMVEMTPEDLFEAVEIHAADGVDFMTVHCGVNRASLEALQSSSRPRVAGVVSRGGALTIAWMAHHQAENPLYQHYDRLLEIARRHDITLSLGDGMRPGSVADAGDAAQVQELITLGELVLRARAAGVQVMVEGPGHVPLHEVQAQVQMAKTLCHGAPLYVLGPLVTDIAPGYDHLTAAIGGALAAWAGADFLCYVTPAEHLGLPTRDHVREGVIAARIAAHSAELARGSQRAWQADTGMSRARQALDWPAQLRGAIDPVRAQQLRCQLNPTPTPACSMCGELCAMDLARAALRPGTRA